MIPIEQEPFIGMCRERSDMKDSTAWVRHLRAGQWPRTDAHPIDPPPSCARLLPLRGER